MVEGAYLGAKSRAKSCWRKVSGAWAGASLRTLGEPGDRPPAFMTQIAIGQVGRTQNGRRR